MTSNPEPAETPEPTSATGSTHRPFGGHIARVTGRRAEGGQRGQPALRELALETDDGSVLEFDASAGMATGRMRGLAEIPGLVFLGPARAPLCPICLDEATLKEHVPQGALGGEVMTLTCARCNNQLGSTVEAELQHWFDSELTRVGIDHDGEVPGKRHLPNLFFVPEKEGERFVFLTRRVLA